MSTTAFLIKGYHEFFEDILIPIVASSRAHFLCPLVLGLNFVSWILYAWAVMQVILYVPNIYLKRFDQRDMDAISCVGAIAWIVGMLTGCFEEFLPTGGACGKFMCELFNETAYPTWYPK